VSSGTSSTSGSRDIPTDTNVEGCFHDFNSLLQITMKPGLGNNLRCRRLCSDNNFSLAATSGNVCHCGNSYPAIWYLVDWALCDNPCNPDKSTCESLGCCGSQDSRYYTVTFAKSIDVVLQLLRQLAFDYRENAPTFRRYIENKMTKSAILQVRCGLDTWVWWSRSDVNRGGLTPPPPTTTTTTTTTPPFCFPFAVLFRYQTAWVMSLLLWLALWPPIQVV